MNYSLFLGPGPVGPIEIFSALCKKTIDGGTDLDSAVSSNHKRIKEIAFRYLQTQNKNPFPGCGTSGDFEKEFERCHPLSLYEEFSRLALPHMDLPIIVVEGEFSYYRNLCKVIDEANLENILIAKQMRFEGRLKHPESSGVDMKIPNVNTLIDEKGFPSLIAGAHFLSIGVHHEKREYANLKIGGNIPHPAITSLIGDNTQLLFLEEGDLIYDEGTAYSKVFNGKKGLVNGLQEFRKWSPRILQLADEKGRSFNVDIFPEEYLSSYDRKQGDYGQVLVSIRAKT